MKKTMKISTLLLGLLASTSVFAGASVTVVYQPAHGAAISAPTLSGMMLLVLGLLLGAMAIRMLKHHQSGITMLVGVFAIAGLISGASGITLISDAIAAPSNNNMSNPAGGNVTDNSVSGASSLHNFTNTSGVPQSIVSITSNSMNYTCGPAAANGCIINNTYQNAEFCTILCSFIGGT